MTIQVGDTVKLTRAVSIEHFTSVGLSIVGKIVRIDMDNFQGVYHRPYFIEFPDRPGEWAFGRNEVKKCNPKR